MCIRDSGLPVRGIITPYAKIETEFLSSESNDILFTVVGTIKGKISLIEVLPDNFKDFQIAYFTKNCRSCNKHIKEKALCLICGEIIYFNFLCCPYEDTVHAQECNRGIGLYIYIYYGIMIIAWMDTITLDKNSLYKTKNQKSVLIYTRETFMSSKALSECKLDKATFEKWNYDYATDKLQDIVNQSVILS
eukprot:TRINITY_DN8171_c0_g1_i6.p1 TRINITY_DN8171_c0_g1~~TRINITY_DN8171_c0_g1_i6.p1  ORF type:complete len:191 (-),score=21.06 TRINITY_DN8171_c0_g1_i6:170-742(-)